jgi:hypothetical protein
VGAPGLEPGAFGRRGLQHSLMAGLRRCGGRGATAQGRRAAGRGGPSRSGRASADARRELKSRAVPTPPRDTTESGDAALVRRNGLIAAPVQQQLEHFSASTCEHHWAPSRASQPPPFQSSQASRRSTAGTTASALLPYTPCASAACMNNRKRKRKKKGQGTKSLFHSCYLTSWARNEYFNVFGVFQQIWHKVECPLVNLFSMTIGKATSLLVSTSKFCLSKYVPQGNVRCNTSCVIVAK